MVSVVSSRVRPSLSSGKATKTTSSTRAPAAISPAISPTDTRAPVWGTRPLRPVRSPTADRPRRPGPVTLVAARRRRPSAIIQRRRPPADVEQGSVRPHPVVDDPDASGAGADRLAQLQGHDVASGPVG